MKQLDAYGVELSGLHLIEASAGTGKTHAITTLYLRAVIELDLLPEQILVVTFTRAATGELRERIRARLRLAQACLDGSAVSAEPEVVAYLASQGSRERCSYRLERALLVIDQAAVMTIHGFCAKVLEQNAFESRMPFGTELVESLDALLDEVVNDFMVTQLASQGEVELRAMRSIGLGAEELRALGQFVLQREDCILEPPLAESSVTIGEALDELERCRASARVWLDHEPHQRALAGLNKSKPPGAIGTRLAGYVEKVKTWLEEPFHRLKEDCATFERLFELAEKSPSAKTPELLNWFSSLNACSRSFVALRRAVLEFGVKLRKQFVEYLLEQFELRKAVRDVKSYDDLLRRLRDSLVGLAGEVLANSLRERYPLALIDEFQDTDPIQFEVFSRIYQHSASLFLIGDPKQSIYGFRGADVDNYLAAKHDQRVHCHTLHTNWRSDPGLVAGVHRLYRSHPDPFMGAGIEYVDVAPKPTAVDVRDAQGANLSGVRILWPASDGDDSNRGIAKYRARKLSSRATVEHVGRLLRTEPSGWGRAVRASDIAVLGRTNRECQAMANALRARGIRCVQTSDSSVLCSDAAGSLAILLRALLRPNEPRRVTAFFVDELAGESPANIERMRADTDAWECWVERLNGYRRIWERSGLLATVVRMCDELDVKQRVLQKASGERFLTDLFHVAELAQVAAKQQRLMLEGQLDWVMQARSGDMDGSLEDQQLRIEADSEAVLLTTVHRSKGLEFPFVICPFLWDGGARRRSSLLAYRRRMLGDAKGNQVLHLEPRLLKDDAAEFELAQAERLRENARLLYVALTRAKHQVAVVWVKAQGFEHGALGRLLFGARALDEGTGDARAMPIDRQRLSVTREALVDLCDTGAVVVEDCSAEVSRSSGSVPLQASSLVEPPGLTRVVTATVQTTSYSALTAVSMVHAEVGRDVDALAPVPLLGPSSIEAAWVGPERLAPELPLLALPAGTRTGEALHAILEQADFQRFEAEGGELDVAGILERFGLDGREFEAKVRRGLCAAMNVPLMSGNPELKLCNVTQAQRRSEFEFLMKVEALSVASLVRGLGPELTGLDASYADDLARLRFDPVTGYLRGFIDLVFEHAGRFYLVDYKSNALGDSAESFEVERLKQEMRRHHYPVQAAIYAAAADRWLRVARVGYDYEAHFGGVFYLFLRGMVPDLGAESGVFFHRPSAQAVGAFEAMLDGRSS